MNYKNILMLWVCMAICFSEVQSQEKLFKGTFDGWTFGYEETPYDSSKVWQIRENDELHVMGKGFKQSGMRTNKKYGNYELTIEYKWLSPGFRPNSGIWIHGQDDWAIDKGAFPTSIEVQLWKRHACDLLRKGMEIEAEAGYPSQGEAVFRRADNPIIEYYHNEWNTIKIRCEGTTITVWQNGLLINKGFNCNFNGKPVTEGYITLQSEWFNIAFRNIVVKNIEKTKAVETEIITDKRDRQTYRTVKIGKQVWFAENLRFYTPDSRCYDDKNNYCKTYGRLYTWETAKKVCPDGWHLPVKEEWTELMVGLGGHEVAGEKLKSINGWELSDGKNYGTNTTGFDALPGGYFATNNNWYGTIGRYGGWWSSSPCGPGAWSYNLEYSNKQIFWNFEERGNGCSVRCVKD